MNLFSVLLLLASADPAAAGASGAAQAQPEEEKKICRRIDSTESRMGSKRVCKTAREWKAEQYDSDEGGIARARAASTSSRR